MKLVLSIFLSIITSLYAITFEEAIANFNSKNYVEAYDQFSELALDDDANAQYNVALMNYKGLGVNKNLKLGKNTYSKKLEGLVNGGVYFVTLNTGTEKVTQKIIVEN